MDFFLKVTFLLLHIYQKLNIAALQNCLNWCLIRDMFGQIIVLFSLSFLVAQMTVEQISLNLEDDKNSLKLNNILSFVEIGRFLCEQKDWTPSLENLLVSPNQNIFQLFSWKQEWLNLYISKIENYLATSDATQARKKNTKTGSWLS